MAVRSKSVSSYAKTEAKQHMEEGFSQVHEVYEKNEAADFGYQPAEEIHQQQQLVTGSAKPST